MLAAVLTLDKVNFQAEGIIKKIKITFHHVVCAHACVLVAQS